MLVVSELVHTYQYWNILQYTSTVLNPVTKLEHKVMYMLSDLFFLFFQVTPFGKKQEATEKKLGFAAGNSDHLTMLNAYNVSSTPSIYSCHVLEITPRITSLFPFDLYLILKIESETY